VIHDGDYTLLGLYGLAFFTLGVALAARALAFERSPLRDRLLAFAAFAGVHGVFEWLYRAAIYSAAPVTTDGLLAFAATAYAPLLLLVLLERGLRPLYA
jgi:hypothetical protein